MNTRKMVCFRKNGSFIIQLADCPSLGYAGEMKLIGEPLKRFPLIKWKDAQNYTIKAAKKEGLMFWLRWDFNKIQRGERV